MTLRYLVILFAVFILAVTPFAVGCSKEAPEEVESETVVPVKTEPAQVGDIRATLHVTGTVTPAPGADLVVVAPEPARIGAMPKAEGDAVASGRSSKEERHSWPTRVPHKPGRTISSSAEWRPARTWKTPTAISSMRRPRSRRRTPPSPPQKRRRRELWSARRSAA